MTEAVEPVLGRTTTLVRNITISKALRKALEEAALKVSPNPGSDTLQELKSENVLGYVRSYKILDEVSTGEDYKITLEVDVDSEGLKNKIEGPTRMGITADDKSRFPGKKPSILITILQDPDSNPVIKTLPTSDIKREIAVVLIGSGYRVVTESSGDIELETYLGVKTTESEIGESVDYYVLGYVQMRVKDKYGKATNEVGDSSYLTGADMSKVSLEALKSAGAKAARKLKSELDKELDTRKAETFKPGTVEVLFTGLRNYAQYEEIDGILAKSVPGVEIRKRVFSAGKISFLVFSKVGPDELAGVIQDLMPKDLSLRLDNASYGRIEYDILY